MNHTPATSRHSAHVLLFVLLTAWIVHPSSAAATPNTATSTWKEVTHQRQVERVIPVTEGARIEIHHSTGPIRLSSSEDPAARELRFRATIEAAGQGAEDFVRDTEIRVETSPDRIAIDTAYPRRDHPLSFETALLVVVPRGHEVEITSGFGSVDAIGIAGSLSIRTDNGRVTVADGQGSLRVDASFGDLSVRAQRGAVRVRVQNGDLSLESIDGDATVDAAFGAAAIHAITGRLKIHGQTARVQVSEVGGAVESEGFACSHVFKDLGDGLRVHAQTGEVEARNVVGRVEIDANFGILRLEDIHGDLRIHGRTLTVSAKGVRGDVECESSAREVTIEEVVGDCRVEQRNARIAITRVHGRLDVIARHAPVEIVEIEGPVDARGDSSDFLLFARGGEDHPVSVQTTFGDIEIVLPKDPSVTLTVETSLGEIGSDVPLRIRAPYSDERRGEGSAGSGTRRIDLRAESGSVRIRIDDRDGAKKDASEEAGRAGDG